jgi:hypothetical protein
MARFLQNGAYGDTSSGAARSATADCTGPAQTVDFPEIRAIHILRA